MWNWVAAIPVVLAAFVLVIKARGRFALTGAEGMAIVLFALLGMLQGVTQHQIQMDDWLFTAGYIAIPVVLGALRGPFEGYVGTSFGLSTLLVVATTHPLGGNAAALEGDLVPAEWVGLWLVLSITTVVAGLVGRKTRVLVPLVAVLGLLFPLAQQAEILLGLTPWIAASLAVALSGSAITLYDLYAEREEAAA